jgi:D-3-phosphoglycerate dehydrogenase
MMQDRIVILDTGYDSFAYEEKLFTDAGYRFEIYPGDRHDREGKKLFASDAQGIFVRWTKIDDDFLQATPEVKAIARYGVGYDNINLESVNRFDVKVSIVQGYANQAVSDHAIAMMYSCARGLQSGISSLRDSFGAPPIRDIFEFHDKTVGIIGLGRIGGTFCKKVKPLFEKVLASDPYISDQRFETLGAIKTNLNDLLEKCDVISIHCNLTEETTELINRETLGAMIKRPILINTSRGPVINEDDLYQAVKDERLHSVGLDVFNVEPPLENRNDLIDHPRVISTGHYAWYSTASAVELQKRAADNLLSMLKGEIPEDCLNP